MVISNNNQWKSKKKIKISKIVEDDAKTYPQNLEEIKINFTFW